MVNSSIQTTTKINADLAREREKCTFDTLELTNLLDGGPEETRKRRAKESFFFDDEDLMSGPSLEYLSYEEKHEELARKMYILSKRIEKLKTEEVPDIGYRTVSGMSIGPAIFRDSSPLDVHYGMFIPTIAAQGTEEQKQKWLKRAMDCNILGTYAQTELGHGTYIRGLETMATYDPQSKEFILNSPTLTSYKWWPGSLGNTCNYAVVLAQLYTLGKCYGVHPFVVQIRDEETHRPMPGVKVGDIGGRLGMHGANNGYLGFDNVCFPKDHLLMKNSKVLDDGTYIASVNSKLTYGTMVRIRVEVVKMAVVYIKKSVIIAVRYSCVRRQSQIKTGEPECQIIDYVTQQYKLFPLMATIFAFHYSALWLQNLLNKVTSDLESGNLAQLPELHAMASCLKAVSAADAVKGVETCRLACGGHGYMMSSSFPTLYGLATPMVTYEGENTILLLQTARSLMKAWARTVEGKPLASIVEYLGRTRGIKGVPFRKSIDWIVSIMEITAARKIELTWNHIRHRTEKGMSPEDAWNATSIELCSAAEIHARTFFVKTYRTMMSTIANTLSRPLKEVQLQLLDLYGVHTILNLRGDLLRFTDTDGRNIETLQAWLEELLELIRPNAVGIVDAFDIRDEILSSALGAYDGNVYERLYNEASKSPLNSETVNKTFELYLKPFMKSKC